MSKDLTKFRISVFRSNCAISAQIIDDAKGVTLFSISTSSMKEKLDPTKKAFVAGELLARKAKEKSISNVYFDRNGYRYHGRVKSLAEGIRAGGLEF